MTKLARVKSTAVSSLTSEVRSGKEMIPNLDVYVQPFNRDVDLEPLMLVVDEAMDRFPLDAGRTQQRTQADAWLAPRVHASLRLKRREAADATMWLFVATVIPEYVQYRWGEGRSDAVPLDRYFGPTYKQSFARLWWMAEMTRNASDYTDVATAMLYQDVPNTLLRLDAYHNRAFALEIVRYIDRSKASSKQINTIISRMLNAALVTRSLDAIALMASTSDSIAMRDWLSESPNLDQMLAGMPAGPNDFPVDDKQLAAVRKLIADLCDPVLAG